MWYTPLLITEYIINRDLKTKPSFTPCLSDCINRPVQINVFGGLLDLLEGFLQEVINLMCIN